MPESINPPEGVRRTGLTREGWARYLPDQANVTLMHHVLNRDSVLVVRISRRAEASVRGYAHIPCIFTVYKSPQVLPRGLLPYKELP